MASLSAEYDQVKVKTKKANEQYKEYNEKYTALKASVQGEMKQIQTELAELRKSIDPEKMKKYDEKRNATFPVLVPLNGNRCGRCGMELSMKALADLEAGEVIECDNCRTIVYNQK
jgi:predicted  nucleic acid-binding Zn-ribbon protein